MKRFVAPWLLVLCLITFAAPAQAWHDKTHLAVARAAGMNTWYNSAAADVAKVKAGNIEAYNHYCNNPEEVVITPDLVLSQVSRYNQRTKADADGHLYGAIIGALRGYDTAKRRGRYPEYHLAYASHYIADLSQPLHSIPYDDYNKSLHHATDGIVDKTIFEDQSPIISHMYDITLSKNNFERDLAIEIARIANISRKLGFSLRKENRLITPEEAAIQLGHSASLLKAVLQHYQKP